MIRHRCTLPPMLSFCNYCIGYDAMKSKRKYIVEGLIQKSYWIHLFLALCIIIGLNWNGLESDIGSFDAIDCRSLYFREKLWAEKEVSSPTSVFKKCVSHLHRLPLVVSDTSFSSITG